MLTNEQIEAIFKGVDNEDKGKFTIVHGFARTIESEVRKQDEALIRQLLAALESVELAEASASVEIIGKAAIAAARARLGEGGA